ncbi:unnamed protein product, partial [Nesidiocoris tenuis]
SWAEASDRFAVPIGRVRIKVVRRAEKSKSPNNSIMIMKMPGRGGNIDSNAFAVPASFDASQYAHYVFNTIKHNQGNETGKISFEVSSN